VLGQPSEGRRSKEACPIYILHGLDRQEAEERLQRRRKDAQVFGLEVAPERCSSLDRWTPTIAVQERTGEKLQSVE
jgi:hypothetical protein